MSDRAENAYDAIQRVIDEALDQAETVWETCTNCGREYRYPHLCREHMLCGTCHPPMRRLR